MAAGIGGPTAALRGTGSGRRVVFARRASDDPGQ